MRLLIDENLSYRIAEQLQGAGHDAVHVTAVGLDDTDDDVILAAEPLIEHLHVVPASR